MDIIYKSSAPFLTEEQLLNAGYLSDRDDCCNINDIFPSTELPNKQPHDEKTNVVLLTTGSFAPVHEGHINLIKTAMHFAEKEGYHVLGGYLSPSHDYYVQDKVKQYYNTKNITDYNADYFSGINRCHLINKIIKNDNNLFLDPWESLFNTHNINFTQVILHLKNYLYYHLQKKIEVIYVFGEDNIDFSNAFLKMGKAYCVGRNSNTQKSFSINKNVQFIPNNKCKHYSSTSIRSDNTFWTDTTENKKQLYIIRDDYYRSIPCYINKNTQDTVYIQFKQYLENTVHKLTDIGNDVAWVDEKMEQKSIQQFQPEWPVVSLDKNIQMDYFIESSRLFKLSSFQHESKEFYLKSIEGIPESPFILFDDDTVSGLTKNYFISHYPQIEYMQTLMDLVKKQYFNQFDEIYDVIDLRDFIFNSKYGGLMTKFGKSRFRVPYIFPFVNLVNRMNLKPTHQLDFSIKIVELNILLYQDKNILISDTSLFFNWLAQFFNIEVEQQFVILLQHLKQYLEQSYDYLD